MRCCLTESWDNQAEGWDEIIANPSSPHYYYYRTADFYIADLAKDAKRMLELGCGTSSCAISIVRPNQTILVTDFSRRMVRKAKKNIADSRIEEQILPFICDAQMLPFDEKCFDVVFSRGVLLSYAKDPSKLLEESGRVLKNGGMIGFDAMNYGDWAKELESKMAHEISTMGGTLMSEKKDTRVIYLFSRQYVQNRRIVEERRVLREDGRLVQLFQKHQKEGPKGPLNLREEPQELERETVTSEISYRTFFEPEELKNILEDAGFKNVEVHPLGCLCNLMSLPWNRERNKDLANFIEKNRDWFCKLEKALSGSWKLDTAWHLFVKAAKD